MTHDELLAEIDEHISWHKDTYTETYAEYITRCTCQEKKYPCDGKKAWVSLRAVVELIQEKQKFLEETKGDIPMTNQQLGAREERTKLLAEIKQAIEKELK